MPSLSSPSRQSKQFGKPKSGGMRSFIENEKLAKLKAAEKQAPKAKIKLEDLAMFTQQLSSMLLAGLPLVTAMDALQEQTSSLVFRVILRNVRNDVAGGTAFSEAVGRYPNAFPKLFISMVKAGEASGNLGDLLKKTASYFEEAVKLAKRIKSAMTYPITVILFAIVLVNVLIIFVIPVFGEMFADFDAELPAPTQLLLDVSFFMKSYIIYVLIFLVTVWTVLSKFFRTPKGRHVRDYLIIKAPVFGELIRKVSLTRFCRTFAILLKSGVPILQSLEIVASGSDNVYIEKACLDISRHVSQGGAVSEVLAATPYFPPVIMHMVRAGEQTGDIDSMLVKISDFYDVEIESMVGALTSLLEPLLIIFLGVVVGGIVICMFLPIFQMSTIIKA